MVLLQRVAVSIAHAVSLATRHSLQRFIPLICADSESRTYPELSLQVHHSYRCLAPTCPRQSLLDPCAGVLHNVGWGWSCQLTAALFVPGFDHCTCNCVLHAHMRSRGSWNHTAGGVSTLKFYVLVGSRPAECVP